MSQAEMLLLCELVQIISVLGLVASISETILEQVRNTSLIQLGIKHGKLTKICCSSSSIG